MDNRWPDLGVLLYHREPGYCEFFIYLEKQAFTQSYHYNNSVKKLLDARYNIEYFSHVI